MRQLLEHGFFHADPHPGNLLAMADGRLAYLDFGMMSRIKPYQRYGLIEAVVHLVNRDFDSLAEDYVKLDFLTPDVNLQPIVPALAGVFGNALGATVAELNFKSITDQMSGDDVRVSLHRTRVLCTDYSFDGNSRGYCHRY